MGTIHLICVIVHYLSQRTSTELNAMEPENAGILAQSSVRPKFWQSYH